MKSCEYRERNISRCEMALDKGRELSQYEPVRKTGRNKHITNTGHFAPTACYTAA